MSEEKPDGTKVAPTLDHPAKRPTMQIVCTRTRCPYHERQASDDSHTMMRLLCRDAAPYLLRGYFCVCMACLYEYAFRCGLLHSYLVEAIERLTEIPCHMIECEEPMSWGGQIRQIRSRSGALYTYPRTL